MKLIYFLKQKHKITTELSTKLKRSFELNNPSILTFAALKIAKLTNSGKYKFKVLVLNVSFYCDTCRSFWK